MKHISNNTLSEESILDYDNSNYPTELTTDVSQDYSECQLLHSMSDLMQINYKFLDIGHETISDLVSSIHSNNLPQYRYSMHIFLKSCMSKSLQYLRLFKVEPLTSSEKIKFDPTPDKDEYIVRNKGEYGSLQYMCDYFKYYMLENFTEIVSPINEFIVNCIEENDCVEKINIIKKKTNLDKCLRFEAEYGPTVYVPPIRNDCRIMYTKNGYSLKLLLDKLMQNTITSGNKELTNPDLISKFIFPISLKKLISSNNMIKRMKFSNNNATNNWYAESFMKYHLLLTDKFKQTSNNKKSMIRNNTNMDSIIKDKEKMRNADLKARDMIIRSFMIYYLSLKNKFKHMYENRFKYESAFITEDFKLPIPKEWNLLAPKLLPDDQRYKINFDTEIVRHRMNNYLSKLKIYKEKITLPIIINKKVIATFSPVFLSTSLDKIDNIVKDISIQKSSNDIGTNSTNKKPQRSFDLISGINISSSITRIDPELVDPGAIADIIFSLENKNVSGYLAALSNFTARFMCKSLKYVRAFKVDIIDYNTIYLISRNIDDDPDMDEYIVQSNGRYTRLQYMCDYFKYHVLKSQLETLAYEEINNKEETLPLLSTIDSELTKYEPQVETTAEKISSVSVVDDEYDLLIRSVKRECLYLTETRKKLISDINANKNKIISLLRPLDCSTRDELIKCLMEYYLLVIDKFEFMANLEFKNISRPLNKRLVLPVPKLIAEIIHREIYTDRTLHDYYVIFRENFFCDDSNCLCTNSLEYNSLTIIRRIIMEKATSRMKEYLLSLDIEDNG
ncbi:hypothetical protein Ark11_1131 [Candidatus Ichthyocystis hellenicum]|uniref:Uncharacterized protein n=1 Tax=Candidatus Ichthyocystis hellenicum TaxID=1561003 RepID=A0A0S4M715_9BURK|nr:hypothetical protein [Candidatus Ichthyocystis hellenicum]CUT17944.1 hypothetical protein Ark11_1131 [Candidatus Ichthyocystis hellenicum]